MSKEQTETLEQTEETLKEEKVENSGEAAESTEETKEVEAAETNKKEEADKEAEQEEARKLLELSDEEFLKKFGDKPPVIDEQKKEDVKEEVKNALTSDIDYKKAYEELFKPIKVGNKEIKPESVEDAIALMKKGISSSTERTANIKPLKKISQSLDRAGINEEELNFLIDIHKGDTEAIKTLLKKHSIDPLDLDLDGVAYIPKENIVDESAVDISLSLDEIKASSHYDKVKEVINRWDSESQKALFSNIQLLKGLHDEIAVGRFDEVQKMADYNRAVGRVLNTASDLDAYITTLKEYEKKRPTPVQTKPVLKPVKTAGDKKAAAPTQKKAAVSKDSVTPKDIMSMSDEEFMKLKASNF
jgi:hypothetical protein